MRHIITVIIAGVLLILTSAFNRSRNFDEFVTNVKKLNVGAESTVANGAKINHLLGKTPEVVLVQVSDNDLAARVSEVNGIDFTVVIQDCNGNGGTATILYWQACKLK